MRESIRSRTLALITVLMISVLSVGCVDTQPTGPGTPTPEDEPGELTSGENGASDKARK